MEIPATVNEATISFQQWGYLQSLEAMRILDVSSPESMSVKGAGHVDAFRQAVSAFKQRWGLKYGLKLDDELDEDTVALMKRRYCNCPDVMRQGGRIRKWNQNTLRWKGTVVIGNTSFSEAQTYTRNEVARVCGMILEVVPGGRVNINSYHKRLDGPGNTLAQAWLPGTPSDALRVTLNQEFDSSETNVTQENHNRTTLHETLHSLGVGHTSGNVNQKQIMDPYLNPELYELQPQFDIAQLVKRYGPSQGIIPTEPEPPEPEEPTEPEEPDMPGEPDTPTLCPKSDRKRIRALALAINDLLKE